MSRETSPRGSPQREALLEELVNQVRANQRATDRVDELVGQLLGVNRTDGRCLDILDQHGQMSAGTLAAASGLTTGAITAVLDRLERAGYARRFPDPADRRRVLVELTAKTREAVDELYGPMVEKWEPISHLYSEADLELLIDFQRRSIETQAWHVEHLRELLGQRETKPTGASAPA